MEPLSTTGVQHLLSKLGSRKFALPELNPQAWLTRLRERLAKRSPQGMAALYATAEGVGLVHLVPGEAGRSRVAVGVFKEVGKGESPGRVAQGLIKAHQLGKTPFVGVLDRGAYVLLPAEAPDVPREEWAATMKWRIKDQITFPVTQAVLEVFDMPGTGSSDADSGRIYVAAAKENEVRRHLQLFHDAGVDPIALDIQELALLNFTRTLEDVAEGVALLHLEAKSGQVMMIKSGRFYLARRIESGLESLMASLDADGSGVDRAPYMDRVALEVQRTMDYFESHFSQAPASSLYIAPFPQVIEGVRQALAQRLGMRVRYLPLSESLEMPEGWSEVALARALPAIGAAMGACRHRSDDES
ncbi:MAG: hypothetical protein HQM00_14845 [Magnetococcales bacterium]|nr:hypothetical protein [Magnetococcales bacterium]